MSLTGTFKAKKKDGSIYYRSSITYKNKHISLGSFSTEEAAHEAYLQAVLLLGNPQILLEDYKDSSPLSFEKWVVLTNFRDNNIYFVDGNLLIDDKNYDEAMNLINEFQEKYQTCPAIYNSLTRIYYRLKELDKALESINKYLEFTLVLSNLKLYKIAAL